MVQDAAVALNHASLLENGGFYALARFWLSIIYCQKRVFAESFLREEVVYMLRSTVECKNLSCNLAGVKGLALKWVEDVRIRRALGDARVSSHLLRC